MKVFKPLVGFLITLIVLSVVLGLLLPEWVSALNYSPTIYLIVCFTNAAHFLEEDFTKAWKIEGSIRTNEDGTPKPPLYDKAFFVAFSHAIVLISFLFYVPIDLGMTWAIIYGLGVALNGIGNGLVHFGIYAKIKKNTGCISGAFQLVFGILLIGSIAIPIFPF